MGLEEGEPHEIVTMTMLCCNSSARHPGTTFNGWSKARDPLQAEAPVQGPVAGHNRWDTAEFTTDADKDKFHRLMVRWQLPAAVHCLSCSCSVLFTAHMCSANGSMNQHKHTICRSAQLGVMHLVLSAAGGEAQRRCGTSGGTHRWPAV